MCPYNYNRFWDAAIYWSKIVNFFIPLCIRRPRYRGSRRNITTPFGMEKLEWCGYHMVQKFQIYLYLFWRNSRTWRADRGTDRHRVTAYTALMYTHRPVKTVWTSIGKIWASTADWLCSSSSPSTSTSTRNTNRDLHKPYSTVSFTMTFSNLVWLSKIFNVTNRSSFSLQQLSFLFETYCLMVWLCTLQKKFSICLAISSTPAFDTDRRTETYVATA